MELTKDLEQEIEIRINDIASLKSFLLDLKKNNNLTEEAIMNYDKRTEMTVLDFALAVSDLYDEDNITEAEFDLLDVAVNKMTDLKKESDELNNLISIFMRNLEEKYYALGSLEALEENISKLELDKYESYLVHKAFFLICSVHQMENALMPEINLNLKKIRKVTDAIKVQKLNKTLATRKVLAVLKREKLHKLDYVNALINLFNEGKLTNDEFTKLLALKEDDNLFIEDSDLLTADLDTTLANFKTVYEEYHNLNKAYTRYSRSFRATAYNVFKLDRIYALYATEFDAKNHSNLKEAESNIKTIDALFNDLSNEDVTNSEANVVNVINNAITTKDDLAYVLDSLLEKNKISEDKYNFLVELTTNSKDIRVYRDTLFLLGEINQRANEIKKLADENKDELEIINTLNAKYTSEADKYITRRAFNSFLKSSL